MKHLYLVGVAFVACIMAGCAGGTTSSNNPNNPSTPEASAFNLGRTTSIPGLGTKVSIQTAKAQNNFDWSLTPKAYAQTSTPTLVVTGPSNGFCTQQPALNLATPPNSFFYTVYGAGQINDPTCTILRVLDKSAFVAAATEGIDIYGDGTLQGFLVKVGSGTGQGITGEVWVQRNGAALQTPITCTIPPNTTGEVRCTDASNSFSVLDGDKAIIILSGTPGDTYQEIRWLLGKN